MKNVILLAAITILFSGCAQIKNTYYVQGDNNVIKATDTVNKATEVPVDVTGSGYGDVSGGGK